MPPRTPGRRSRWIDRGIGVVLGVVLGLAVIIVFVFYGSEGTIDAPRISTVQDGRPGGPQRLQLVRVINGAPPPSGPVGLDFEQGRRARFLVDSDASVGIQIPGYGFHRSVAKGRTLVGLQATKPGLFPVVVAGSHIDIATLRVSRR